MSGLKPAVVGLIGAAVISVGGTVFAPNGVHTAILLDISFYAALVTFLLCSILAFKKVHPIPIIFLSAVIGIIFGYLPL